jgi:hypothetical protein
MVFVVVFIDEVSIPYLPTQKAHFIVFCVGFGSALFCYRKTQGTTLQKTKFQVRFAKLETVVQLFN